MSIRMQLIYYRYSIFGLNRNYGYLMAIFSSKKM